MSLSHESPDTAYCLQKISEIVVLAIDHGRCLSEVQLELHDLVL
jgi:hypothetical protein